jgi:hypothetical protein
VVRITTTRSEGLASRSRITPPRARESAQFRKLLKIGLLSLSLQRIETCSHFGQHLSPPFSSSVSKEVNNRRPLFFLSLRRRIWSFFPRSFFPTRPRIAMLASGHKHWRSTPYKESDHPIILWASTSNTEKLLIQHDPNGYRLLAPTASVYTQKRRKTEPFHCLHSFLTSDGFVNGPLWQSPQCPVSAFIKPRCLHAPLEKIR